MSDSPFLSNCSADSIRDAAAALKAGHLVAFPTETVYGLGADARNPEAVKRIYEVKGRPTDHPLIVHISSINQLEKWASEIQDYAISLAREFWPGPMTLILKRTDFAGDFITGGQETVGLRVPSDPIALALIQEFEKITESGIAAPSANRFGQVSPTCSQDVIDELGNYLASFDHILDGGNSSIGIESTIIDCTTKYPRILRPGFVTSGEIEYILGVPTTNHGHLGVVKHSGSFEKHYAPKARVHIDREPLAGEALIALEAIKTPPNVIRISTPRTVEALAQTLYSSLRQVDNLGIKSVVVMQPAGEGLAEAVRDRVAKANNGR